MIMAHTVHYHRVAAGNTMWCCGREHSQSMHPHMKCTLHTSAEYIDVFHYTSACRWSDAAAAVLTTYTCTCTQGLQGCHNSTQCQRACTWWLVAHTNTSHCGVCHMVTHIWHAHCSLALTHVWHPDTSTHLAAVALCTSAGCAPPAICACCIPTRQVGWAMSGTMPNSRQLLLPHFCIYIQLV